MSTTLMLNTATADEEAKLTGLWGLIVRTKTNAHRRDLRAKKGEVVAVVVVALGCVVCWIHNSVRPHH